MSNPFFAGELEAPASVYSATNTGTVTDITTNTDHLIYSIAIRNNNAAVASLQIFDAPASAVTLGTTAPTLSFGMAISGVDFMEFNPPIQLKSGFSIAATTTRAGNTGGSIDANISYTARS